MPLRFRTTALAGACAALLLAATAVAQNQPASDPVGLRGDISGSWYNPAQSGHGLMIELFAPGKAALTWFTFDPNGTPMWLVGVADIGADGGSLKATVSRVSGGRFPPQFDPTAVQTTPWGVLEVDFTGCADGTLSWTPTASGFTAGTMPLRQLTGIDGLRCNQSEEFGETRIYSFERGLQGFEALFADRPPGENAFYELDYAYEPLPAPLQARRGLRLSGNNHSDDLAMLVKAPVEGLLPDTLYRLEMELEMASNIPTGCSGIGGSPGDSVYMKLGAATNEPLTVTDPADNMLRLNFDFGQQSQGGAGAIVVGTLANSKSCDVSVEAPWELKTVTTQGEPLRARTDADGTLWVVAGSDSAFEGRSDWYLTRLQVRLEKVAGTETP
jgi:hypothetical protein